MGNFFMMVYVEWIYFLIYSDLKLVVNEYENLDATYTKLGGNSELNTRQFLRSYYLNKIGNLIKSINKISGGEYCDF